MQPAAASMAPARWWSSRRSARAAARSTARIARSPPASGTGAAAPRPAATLATRPVSAAAWSAACIRPKQSRTTSAGSSPATGVSPRPARSPSQDPPCGLPYSATRPPAGSSPAAATRRTSRPPPARSARRARRRAAPPAPSGRPPAEPGRSAAHSHICSGYAGSGPGVGRGREVVAGRLFAQVEHQVTRPATAGAAARLSHSCPPLVPDRDPARWLFYHLYHYRAPTLTDSQPGPPGRHPRPDPGLTRDPTPLVAGRGGSSVWRIQCRLCGSRLSRTFVDLGMSPLCESYIAGGAAGRSGDLLSAARAAVRVVPARAAARVRVRGAHLLRLRLLLLVLRLLGGARQAVRRHDDRAARPDPGQPGDRGREQRRLPAPAFPGRRNRRARRRARRERGRGRPGHAAFRIEVEFLGPETGQAIAARYGHADLVAGEQRVRARARHPRVRRRAARAGQGQRAWSRWSSRTCSG